MALEFTAGLVAEFICAGLTRAEAAAKLSMCTKTFSKRLDEAGFHYPVPKRKDQERIKADVDAAFGFVVANGGSLTNACKVLDLKTSLPTIRKHIKERGFDLRPYKHMNKRFGDWKVLPSPENAEEGSKYFFCECQRCGVRKKVSRHNLTNKRSSACMSCASIARQALPVNSVDGSVKFESIRSFVNAFGLQEKYQSVRLALKQGSPVEIEGNAYCLT